MISESDNKKPTTGRGRPSKSASSTVKKEVKETIKEVQEEIQETPVKEEVIENEKAVEIVEEKKPEVKEVKAPVQKKSFEPEDTITCRSVVSGRLFMDGIVSAMPYTWLDFGDEVDVEYRDLVAAAKKKNSYVMKPFFVIMDDDFVAQFPFLKDVYSGQYSIKDLAKILTLPVNEMTEAVKELPGNVRETLKGIASTQVSNGVLDSFKKIKALDEILDTDLSLIADMSNE